MAPFSLFSLVPPLGPRCGVSAYDAEQNTLMSGTYWGEEAQIWRVRAAAPLGAV